MNEHGVQRVRSDDLQSYLKELEILVTHPVNELDLLSRAATESLRAQINLNCASESQRIEIPFAERSGAAFARLIACLQDLNRSPVVLWPPRANKFGVLKLPSLASINFSFPFFLNSQGIFAIATEDGMDRLILDFYEQQGRQILEIEWAGSNWTQRKAERFFEAAG
jgi:hypothetical protein